uniref:Uncharacterized protein n=1 Tax=Candidatus Kentrum sp. LPFa TaxID=2126335 RepID=A0A450X2Y1_9GAMM|nr:MAG: hypothetical protein BECKLPF1236B_GA0070989_13702 [Candidatus Kentron sp. LPFa]
MKKTNLTFVLLILGISVLSYHARAIEVAPRISDREIIESLAEIKAEIKAEAKLSHQRFEAIDQRFKAVEQRFEAIDQRFDRFEQSVDQRFDRFEQSVDRRFTEINQRIHMLTQTTLTLFGSLMALIVALFGYIIWDRRTAMRPLERRMVEVEQKVAAISEPARDENSALPRLLDSLRNMAEDDDRLAELVRQYS